MLRMLASEVWTVRHAPSPRGPYFYLYVTLEAL